MASYLLALAGLGIGGCQATNLFDPSDPARGGKSDTLLVPILSTLQVGYDEEAHDFPQARAVEAKDLIPSNSDYMIGKNDLVQVSVSDLAGVGSETVKTARVTESGQISLPLIGTVPAAGLTEADLERAIAAKYADNGIIPKAQVSATVVEARGRVYNFLGAIARPAQYAIINGDYRLIDALTAAGGINTLGVENIYIIRKAPQAAAAPTTEQSAPSDQLNPAGPATRDLFAPTPRSEGPSKNRPVLADQMQTTDPVDAPASRPVDVSSRTVLIDGKAVSLPTTSGATPAPTPVAPTPVAPAPTTSAPETVTVTPLPAAPVTLPADAAMTPAATTSVAAGAFEFHSPATEADAEVIRVPYDRLKAGDLTYNVVIRPNDTLIVQEPRQGNYYMGGHVGRGGVYTIGNGNNVTLKQAFIAAGGFDGVAIPERTDVIRRIGADKEVWVRINMAKIFEGKQSDFYLRSNDVVTVGTNGLAPFVAAIRGAFRFTYGFGFLYDRNY